MKLEGRCCSKKGVKQKRQTAASPKKEATACHYFLNKKRLEA